jgi:hypothetical protein
MHGGASAASQHLDIQVNLASSIPLARKIDEPIGTDS